MIDEFVFEKSIETLAKETANLIVELWFHMLKWDHQRHIQSPGWADSINKQAVAINKDFQNKNVKNKCIENINKTYNDALKKLVSEAINHNEYLTSKPALSIPSEYSLDYILNENNRSTWIHSRCGNPLLKSSKKFKYDTIKETDVRIDPRDALK